MLLATLLLALPLANDVHLDEVHGFRIEVPDGWTRTERELGEEFTLSLLPPGSIGELGVSVTVLALEKGATVEALLELARAKVEEGGEAFSEYEEWETEIAGRSAPGVRALFRAPAGEFRIVQSYLVEGGHGWLLQRHAPVDDWEERARELEAVAATFAFAEITDEGLAERRIDRLVARCGSEVEWADDWEDASERAREEGRLVLVVASLLSGFSIADNPRTALFTDEDVIELVGERFVPLWYERDMTGAFVDAYGLSPTAFGQALVLATRTERWCSRPGRPCRWRWPTPSCGRAWRATPRLRGGPCPPVSRPSSAPAGWSRGASWSPPWSCSMGAARPARTACARASCASCAGVREPWRPSRRPARRATRTRRGGSWRRPTS